MNDNPVLLKIVELEKEYNGFFALKKVSFDIKQGEIHGIVGENGAGKSTLIKTISGAIQKTSGQLIYNNEELILKSPKVAIDKGIGVVYQEFNLFPNLKVYENIFFSIEIKNKRLLDRKAMIKESEKILEKLGFSFDVTMEVKKLSTAYQQIVEIAKCINHQVKLIIMDEPSAPLTENEVEIMFDVVKKLNKQGVTIIYISHKLNEIMHLTNRVSVLRDGKYITTLNTKETTENDLVKLMVGRDIEDIYPKKEFGSNKVHLSCRNISGGIVKDVSFDLHKGEVLGFGGLVGAGRTELVRILFGADPKEKGQIFINDKEVSINNPGDAIKYGIGLIPEDRKTQGLILNKSIYLNNLLPSIYDYSNTLLKLVDFKKSEKDIQVNYDRLKIKAQSQHQKVVYLSGGNQQKVVLCKWILKDCDILILDEPTRGIDIGAKQEIYNLIKDLAKMGKSILVISSEMPELIGMSHRILVMHEGKLTGELRENITQEEIMRLAS